MIRIPLIFIGKFICYLSRLLNIGNGGTWPGELALRYKSGILKDFFNQLEKGCILVVGTNGKTTTSLMVKKILEITGNRVIHNDSGANLQNGIVSSFIKFSSWNGKIKADYGVFEVDENSLPAVISNFKFQISKERKKLVIVFLNLFRDQLDRYGEVDAIAEKWGEALKKIPHGTKIILNSDDPLIAYLGKSVSSTQGVEASGVEARFFGLDDPKLFLENTEHATDSIFCLNCGYRLSYEGIYYSHIGIWKCEKCGNNRPKPDINFWKSPLPGVYNKYNTLAAVSVVKLLGINDFQINNALSDFAPAFGRQEELKINAKKIRIFLSKNPAGFNESLRTVISLGAKEILFVLNDRIPDGLDVSWIWDVDFEMLSEYVSVVVSGDRVYDLAIRLKYSQPVIDQKSKIKNQNQVRLGKNYNTKIKIIENLKEAIFTGLNNVKTGKTLYILATYSAMLEVRKILHGRKIL